MRQLFLVLAATAFVACRDVSQPDPAAGPLTASIVGAPERGYEAIEIGLLPGDTRNRALAVNNAGQVVGWSQWFREPQPAGPSHAFLWSDGVLTDLGTLGGSSIAFLINPGGQVAGTSTTTAGETHAFFWADGVMTDLGTLGGTSSAPSGLNAQGTVVGSSTTASGETHGFVWQSGVLHDLGTLGGDYSAAGAINSAGHVVGEARTSTGDTHAFLWAGGVMTDLGTLGGTSSSARAISNTGAVTGWSTDSAGAQHAFVWQAGVMRDLGIIPGDSWSRGVAVNALGQIAVQRMRSFRERGAFWDEVGGVRDLGTLGGDRTAVVALNSQGQVAGRSTTNTSITAFHAFIWENGVLRDLGLPPGYPTFLFATATGLNERGEVVGYFGNPFNFIWHAVLWRPTPGAPSVVPSVP